MGPKSVPNESEGRKTGFARNSGQIRQKRTFLNLQGLNLCTSHFLVFGCLRDQDLVAFFQKVEGIFCYQDYSVLLTAALLICENSRRHLCPKLLESFERKLDVF